MDFIRWSRLVAILVTAAIVYSFSCPVTCLAIAEDNNATHGSSSDTPLATFDQFQIVVKDYEGDETSTAADQKYTVDSSLNVTTFSTTATSLAPAPAAKGQSE